VLGVTVASLLKKAYGIDVSRLIAEVQTVSNARAAELRLSELTDEQFRDVLLFTEFIRTRTAKDTEAEHGD
jgi:hypothetical protein